MNCPFCRRMLDMSSLETHYCAHCDLTWYHLEYGKGVPYEGYVPSRARARNVRKALGGSEAGK